MPIILLSAALLCILAVGVAQGLPAIPKCNEDFKFDF